MKQPVCLLFGIISVVLVTIISFALMVTIFVKFNVDDSSKWSSAEQQKTSRLNAAVTKMAESDFRSQFATTTDSATCPEVPDFLLSTFHEFIIGVFDNQVQVDQEKLAGVTNLHPFALHIAGDITDKIKWKPENLEGFFILEESYYTYPNLPTNVSPFLFFWDIDSIGGCIRLTSLNIPSNVEPTELKNNNTKLVLDYRDLSVSEVIGHVIYKYDNTTNCFHGIGTNTMSTGTTFTMNEFIGGRSLQITESFYKPSGESLVAYDTPISYDRQITNFVDLYKSLTDGYEIRSVSSYENCQPSPGHATGGTLIENPEIIFNDGEISFLSYSKAQFIYNYQGGRLPYVYDFTRSKIFPNGTQETFATDVFPDFWDFAYEEYFYCSIFNLVTQKGSTYFNAVPRKNVPVLLPTYGEVFKYLSAGRRLRFIRNNQYCSSQPNTVLQHPNVEDSSTSFTSMGTITAFEAFNEARFAPYPFFAFSSQTLSKNDNILNASRYLWKYTKAKVEFNGTVSWTDSLIDPKTYTPVSSRVTVCKLGTDKLKSGTVFYSLD